MNAEIQNPSLSKVEYFAGQLMDVDNLSEIPSDETLRKRARVAVRAAKALVEELEADKPKAMKKEAGG